MNLLRTYEDIFKLNSIDWWSKPKFGHEIDIYRSKILIDMHLFHCCTLYYDIHLPNHFIIGFLFMEQFKS